MLPAATVTTMIGGAISALKNVHDLVVNMKDSAEKNKIMSALLETNGQFLSLQGAISATNEAKYLAEERARAAEQKCRDLENWNVEAENYELHMLEFGIFVFRVKANLQSTQTAHYLCANCFNDRQKSVLQLTKKAFGHGLDCNRCKASLTVIERIF